MLGEHFDTSGELVVSSWPRDAVARRPIDTLQFGQKSEPNSGARSKDFGKFFQARERAPSRGLSPSRELVELDFRVDRNRSQVVVRLGCLILG